MHCHGDVRARNKALFFITLAMSVSMFYTSAIDCKWEKLIRAFFVRRSFKTQPNSSFSGAVCLPVGGVKLAWF